MMTKKTMTILSVFMIVALTAVGFAAWLIVGTIEDEVTGSFVSNELQDKFFKVEVEFDTTTDDKNGQIIFGAPDGDSAGKWLTYKNADAKEKLSAVATIKFTPDAGFDLGTETMEYYLEDVAGNQRTIRVAIDIAELFNEDGSQTSKFYEWYDWAVQLGYIQYPTAKYLTNTVVAEKALSWGKVVEENGEKVIKALTPEEVNEGVNFQNNFLFIDLTYDMFTVDDGKEFATAKIQIDFAWGEAVATGEGENRVYNNPYTYFNTLDAEAQATVLKYLKATTEGQTITYALAATVENAQDAQIPGVEDYNLENAKYIRNKDLAQRMLDYLSNYLSYEAPVVDDEGTVTQAQKGIQFSITLSEGTTIPKA